jgi:anti-sigma factor RsiW
VTCEQRAADLDSYIDGELPAGTAAAFRDHLAACASCRQQAANRQALGRLVRSVPYYHASDRLRGRIAGRAARIRSARRLLTWAAAAVLVVSIGGGISLVRQVESPGRALAGTVLDAHLRSLMADHLFDVRSTDQHTVKPWFLGKLDFSPPVVDLAPIGFPLVGGRLDYLSGRPVAALVYQRQKHTINVFVWPAGDRNAGLEENAIRGFHLRHWARDGLAFWAVSDLNDAELTDFVRALQGM